MISKKRYFFLYELLLRLNRYKNQEYVIEICILGQQYFMINNKIVFKFITKNIKNY